jgi:hypothetical protein
LAKKEVHMEITLTTDILGDTFTAGHLSMLGFTCDTLEPQTRGAGKKVYGFTAIPCGRYKVTLFYSPEHKYIVPLLQNVPGFDYIEIHSAFKSIMAILQALPKNEEIWLTKKEG